MKFENVLNELRFLVKHNLISTLSRILLPRPNYIVNTIQVYKVQNQFIKVTIVFVYLL